MNLLLGSGINSLLYKNVGSKKGLAYNIQTTADGNYMTGDIGIKALVPATKIEESIDAIFEEIERIKTEKMRKEDVERTKKLVKYGILTKFETNWGHIDIIEVKLDLENTPEVFIGGFERVTPEKVMDVAKKYLPDKETGDYFIGVGSPLIKD